MTSDTDNDTRGEYGSQSHSPVLLLGSIFILDTLIKWYLKGS
jgi:hypothetical protein